ncbi:MAG: metallophosphoesterase, partial [Flavobacteriales bacterium]|nr:metallophosphoesterase [Flavobacteriales bacterium]
MKKLSHHMGKTLLYALISIFTLVGISARAQKPYYDKSDIDWAERVLPRDTGSTFTVYLIGDAGAADFSKPAALKVLEGHLQKEDSNSVVIFLGDNIYSSGMPDSSDKHRVSSEKKMNAQLDILSKFKGRVVFVPGNHDWDHWRPTGLEAIKREENYIEQYLDRGNVFRPDQGCPGPSVINLAPNLVLIAIDTQWWLHKWDKVDEANANCPATDDDSFIEELDAALADNKGKQIIVTAHHPIVTNGNHGGYFALKDYIFPLTAKFHNLFIPMPLLGSIYPMSRKHLGHLQDLPHPRYQLLASSLKSVFSKYDNLIYATGHDHNLQYFLKGNQHYIVSGSGSKTTYVAKRHKASFTYARQGFIKLEYRADRELWLEAWVTNDTIDHLGQVAYRRQLVSPIEPPSATEMLEEHDYKDSSITVIAGSNYAAGKLKKFFLGAHYRDAWSTPVKVPLVDLAEEHGGLTPVKIGGGFQTKSLRLGNEEGKEFVFRSIQKDPKKILGEELQKTWIADIMQDQISMSHPYGAFVIAPLAEAVGIYHKNPKLVYIPDDPHLMEYRNLYKNTLALYEERASKHLEGYGNFGNASKAINTRKLLQKIYENNDNVIDAKNLLKNRLFDIWVGDWDRHEDQWRWVKFKCEEVNHDGCFHTIGEEGEDGSLYRPIPRDRDQVFVILDGVFPWLVRPKWTARLLPHFQNTIKDMKGLNINGGHIDRSFLNGLSKADWLSTAETMQAALSDAVIEAAIQQWPDTIFALDGQTIIDKLKHRRDLLVESAERYYTILAKQVDVIGTDGAEYFEILRLSDESTQIRVYTLDSTQMKGRLLFDRTFKSEETKEIRIYGQGANDHFEITGEVKRGILIRIIGGEGKDNITDNSHVKGLGKKTKVYDDLNENEVNTGKETRDLSSQEKDINSYNRKEFRYNYTAPRILFGANVDDGIFIGGGVYFKNYKFRKNRYAMTQKIVGSTALKTGAFNFYYEGRFTHLIKKWDVHLDLAVLAPNSTTNFFGTGNKTVDLKIDDNYHLVRFNGIDFQPALVRTVGQFQSVRAADR